MRRHRPPRGHGRRRRHHQPSPYARSLLFGYVAQFVYEGDSPIAERRAAALSLDQGLLAELLGRAELRELLDPEVLAEVEAELQRLAPDRRARDAEGVADLLRLLGPADAPTRSPRACRRRRRRRRLAGRAGRRTPRGRGPDGRRGALGRGRGRRPAARRARRAGARRAPPTPSPSPSTTRSATWSPATPAPTARSPPPTSRPGSGSATPSPGRPCSGWPPRAGCSRASSARPAAAASGATPRCCASSAAARWPGCARRSSRSTRRPSAGSCRPGSAVGRQAPRRRRRGRGRRPARRLPGAGVRARAAGARRAGSATTSPRSSTSSPPPARSSGPATRRCPAPTAGSACTSPTRPTSPCPSRAAFELTELQQAVLEALAPGGAWFFRQLSDRVGSTDDAALSAALWDLVWAGPGQQRHPRPAARAGPLRHARATAPVALRPALGRRPGGRPARTGPPETAGRWALLPDARHRPDPAGARHRRAPARAARRGHPRRGGAASGSPAASPAVYKVLSAFEDSGRCRRGYFVDGLGAAQFGTAGAIDRLRTFTEPDRRQARRRRARRHRPGQPLRRRTPLAGRAAATESTGHRPGRKAGALVVLVDGALDALRRARRPHPAHVERRRRRCSTPAAAALADAARRGALGRLTVEKADGEAAARRRRHPAAPGARRRRASWPPRRG